LIFFECNRKFFSDFSFCCP